MDKQYLEEFMLKFCKLIDKDERRKLMTNNDITIIDENENTEEVVEAVEQMQEVLEAPEFTTIEEYKEKTGKRFRLTKQEKAEGLTREEAFARRFNL